MSLKVQFIKCALFITLYLFLYLLLIKFKGHFYLPVKSVTEKNDILVQQYKPLVAIKVSTKSNTEIKLLENDVLRGESISLQDSSATLKHVSDTCKKYNLQTSLTRKHFLYNPDLKHKSLYCWIRKIASTSFTKLFCDMRNRSVNENYYREVDFLAPKNLQELEVLVNQINVFKLLIVRHPFHRLVSSYRDRIEDNTKYTAQAWIYAKKILYFTRPEIFHVNKTGNVLQRIFYPNKRLKVVPTFKEFVEWLLHQPPKRDDVHWNQYYEHCALCNVDYNFILKLDSYTFGEINYILSKFGLDRNKIYLLRLEQSRGGLTDFNMTCKYLRTLTSNMIFKLYQRYKIDFEMYNYTLDKYMQCANQNT